MRILLLTCTAYSAFCGGQVLAADPPPRLTTLSDSSIDYRVLEKPYVVLRRADVEAVVVDNRAVDDDVLPGHRAGYSGVASLKHTQAPGKPVRALLRRLELRSISTTGPAGTARSSSSREKHPWSFGWSMPIRPSSIRSRTPHYRLESCLRYQMLEDGTIEMTFECIPRETFV